MDKPKQNLISDKGYQVYSDCIDVLRNRDAEPSVAIEGLLLAIIHATLSVGFKLNEQDETRLIEALKSSIEEMYEIVREQLLERAQEQENQNEET